MATIDVRRGPDGKVVYRARIRRKGYPTAITKEIQHAIRGWRQGDQEILRQPTHEEMYVPISGFEQAAKAPGGDGSGRPPGHLFQRFASRVYGLYEDEPAEDETMANRATRWACRETRQSQSLGGK